MGRVWSWRLRGCAGVGLVCVVMAATTLGGHGGAVAAPATTQAAGYVDWVALAAAREAAERHRRWLKTPQATSERSRSRARFRRQSAGAALRSGRAAFGHVLGAPAWRAPGAADGVRIEEYLTDGVARVRRPGGGTSMIVSDMPLRARDDDGSMAPVDLELVETGDGYEPRNPLVDVQLPERASGRVELDAADLALELPSASGVAGEPVEDKLFYANAWRDADAVVAARPGGVEVSVVIRSPESPETFELGYDAPTGATVRTAGRGVEVVDASGRVVAEISPPAAYDAQGTSVNAVLELRDGRIVLRADHRDKSLAYPVLVDPQVTTDRYGQDTGGSDRWANWDPVSTQPFWYIKNNDILSVQGASYGLNYFNDRYGIWNYVPPSDSYVWQVQTRLINHVPWSSSYVQGIYSEAIGGFEPGHTKGKTVDIVVNPNQAGAYEPYPLYGDMRINWASTAHYNNHVITGIHIHGDGYRDGRMYANWGGTIIWQDEGYAPSAEFVEPGGGETLTQWRKGNSVRVLATDRGLGMQHIRVSVNSPTSTIQDVCGVYARRQPCALVRGAIFTGIPEGVNDVKTRVRDAVDNDSALVGTTLRFDNSAPVVTLSGSLAEADGYTVDDPEYELSISAKDGTYGGPAADRRSGVKSISVAVDGVSQPVEVDGTTKVDPTWTCPENSCARSARYVFKTDRFGDGARNIVVKVTDQVGNVYTRTITAQNEQYAACMIAGDAEYCGQIDREEPATVTDEPEEPMPADGPEDYSDCESEYPGEAHMCTPEPFDANDVAGDDGEGQAFAARGTTATTRRYGLADENPRNYKRAVFDDLKVKRIRKILPYNIMRHRDMITGSYPKPAGMTDERYETLKQQYRNFVEIYDWAGRHDPRVEILVTFQHREDLVREKEARYRKDANGKLVLDGKGQPIVEEHGNWTYRPSLDDYVSNLRRFRRRFGRIHIFSAWNEPNHRTQPTRYGNRDRRGTGPKRAAAYTQALKQRVCKRNNSNLSRDCRVVAGELLDAGRWKQYLGDYKASLAARGVNASYWAFHPYNDVIRSDRFRTGSKPTPLSKSNSSYFHAHIPEDEPLLFTEVGSRIDRNLNGGSTVRQNDDVEFLVDRLAENIGGGVDRLYYYSLCEEGADDPANDVIREDPGLLERGCGAPRAAYGTYRTATLRNPNG